MASITKTFTESGSSYKSTWTVVFSVPDVYASGSQFTINKLSTTAKYVYSGKAYGLASVGYCAMMRGFSRARDAINDYMGVGTLKKMTSGTTYTLAQGAWNNPSFYPTTFNTVDYFNSNNPTERYIDISYSAYQIVLESAKDVDGTSMDNTYRYEPSSGDMALVTSKIILQAPPTFKVVDGGGEETSSVAFDTPYVYAGLTTASINVSDIEAKYGGNISSVVFAIGNQTVTGSTSGGTLSILLNAGGTFTPTVTVTDSRGQTTTKALDTIAVSPYTAPSVSFDIDRTTSAGADDDEGESAVVEASFNWTDVVATLSAPTVSAVDPDGDPVTVTAAWYKDRALTTAISDWSTITASDMPVYGLIDNASHNAFDTQFSYQVAITPNDSEGVGTAIIQTLGSAFYTIDFLAGGHGIAFGQSSSREGFECNMATVFHDTVEVDDALTAQSVTVDENLQGENLLLELDTNMASGPDHDIYTALQSLNWDNDVIV